MARGSGLTAGKPLWLLKNPDSRTFGEREPMASRELKPASVPLAAQAEWSAAHRGAQGVVNDGNKLDIVHADSAVDTSVVEMPSCESAPTTSRRIERRSEPRSFAQRLALQRIELSSFQTAA